MIIKEIKKAYVTVSNEVSFKMINSELMNTIESMLLILLRYKCNGVKCDLENNPPEVIDRGEIVARVYFKKNFEDKYIDLIFGREGFEIIEHPKLSIPTHDPQTGELNPHYKELTGEKNPLEVDAKGQMIGEEFKKQLIEEGINPENVASFTSRYNRKKDEIVTVVTLDGGAEYVMISKTSWYASRKNKKW